MLFEIHHIFEGLFVNDRGYWLHLSAVLLLLLVLTLLLNCRAQFLDIDLNFRDVTLQLCHVILLTLSLFYLN